MSLSMTALLSSNPQLSVLIGGLVIGFAFGFVLHRSNFCVMGGISDFIMFGDGRRLRAWILAGAVAIVGVHLLESSGVVDLDRSRYLGSRINWLSHLVGGFVFGVGMVLAGGCASRNIVRAGGGDLRALLILLVIASFAFAAISGVLAQMRVSLAETTALDTQTLGLKSQRLGDVVAAASSAPRATVTLTVVSLVVLALLSFVAAAQNFRASPVHIVSGIAVGCAVTLAWAVTALAQDDFAARPIAVESLSFVAPVGGTLEWIQRATAVGLPSFGAASVMGTLIGSFTASMVSGTFRLQTFANVEDTLRHMAGAALMGVGGVFALGCTIGQGVSGLSTLSLGSVISMAAIIAGAATTIRVLMR